MTHSLCPPPLFFFFFFAWYIVPNLPTRWRARIIFIHSRRAKLLLLLLLQQQKNVIQCSLLLHELDCCIFFRTTDTSCGRLPFCFLIIYCCYCVYTMYSRGSWIWSGSANMGRWIPRWERFMSISCTIELRRLAFPCDLSSKFRGFLAFNASFDMSSSLFHSFLLI